MNAQSTRTLVRFDEWVVLDRPLELRRDGQPVHLQELPLQILELLIRRPGVLVTREELISRLWPKGVVDFEAGLNTAIRKLRAALNDSADEPKYIETVPRQGYRFIGKIEPIAPEIAVPEEAAPDRTPQVSRLRWAVMAFVVLAGALGLWARHWSADTHTEPRRLRVAVLPFENLSADPANAFFAEGMHEELLSALANRALQFDTISRTTMLLYQGQRRSAPQIARELGATHIVEGSVRREATTVRVTLKVVDATTDTPLWSQTFDRDLERSMTMQAELADQVVSQLEARLVRPDGATMPPPRSLAAYDLWLKGVLAWQQVGAGGVAPQEVARIEDLFSDAIEADPMYAAAYADRGRVRIAKFAAGSDSSEANLQGARSDVATARKLAGETSYVLVREAQLAYLVDGDLKGALALLDKAEKRGRLTPDQTMTYANFLAADGQADRSLALQERAARLDPGNPTIYRFWMNNLFMARRPADALRAARELDTRFPGRLDRGQQTFEYTGDTSRWRLELRRADTASQSALAAEFDLLRYEGRSSELAALLERAPPIYHHHGNARSLVTTVPRLTAELQGWERLLAGDRKGAAAAGRILVAHLADNRAPSRAQWYWHLLAAEAALFRGDNPSADAAAQSMVASAAAARSPEVGLHTRMLAARIHAWTGQHTAAFALLEDLVSGYPGVGPAAITRDPLYSVPLSRNAQWRELADRLEAEIVANRALLSQP